MRVLSTSLNKAAIGAVLTAVVGSMPIIGSSFLSIDVFFTNSNARNRSAIEGVVLYVMIYHSYG